ncbi:MAG TPA: DUF255 domain-containing protein [Candidatus Limnocylindria bacterium]|nr:DUF255 domain-containing protein [Candidatus Limnocylindria bacterium]
MSEFHFSPRPNRAHEIAWRAWGAAAFAEAKQQDKPVLLAISAVWCHWCHVMDETSYSDDEVIRAVNERFIPIRVDNDQRPDVNRRYNMGGWPTTAFLTPNGEILNGATYIPPEAMRHYTRDVADVWRSKRDELAPRLRELKEHEAQADQQQEQKAGELGWEIVSAVGSLIRGQYDPEYGGFGREPKFPQPKLLRFLLDEHRRSGAEDAARMLHTTLDAMASGGMYDALEGGFFRYSTTRAWAIPHFEKMLEDNAELLTIYAEAHRTFPAAGHDRVVRDVMRWMDAVLWREDAQAFSGSQDADEHYYALDLAARERQGAPFVDRRLYTNWNALAASAYIAAGNALADPAPGHRASVVMQTLAKRMWDGAALAHFADGDGPAVRGLLTDYAACIATVLDEYETGERPGALGAAATMARAMRAALEDPVAGGFWDAPQRAEPGRLARREKPIEEGAATADVLLRLALLTGEDEWRTSAIRALQGFAGEYRQWGQFAAAYAAVVARALAEGRLVVVVGAADDAVARSLWQVATSSDDPNGARQRLVPERDAALIAARGYPAGRTAAYVCVGTSCSAPIDAAPHLVAELARARRRFVPA